MQNQKPHAALLASAGMGHLIPVLELGKRLITHHDFHVTIFVVATDPSTTKSLLNSPSLSNLNIITLPLVDISSFVRPSDNVVTKLAVLMRQSIPCLRDAISSLKFRPTALVVDLFGTEAFSVADEFQMLKYVFVTSNAWFLAITIYAPMVEKLVEEEHVNKKRPLKIPGCRPVRIEDTLEAYLKMDDPVYSEYKRVGIEIPMADGILINTWEDLDPTTIDALRDPRKLGKVSRVPVYPVGPLARPVEVEASVRENNVLKWLDNQPDESVVYVSFGSGGTISTHQMKELAWGLESSNLRLIWVVRPPMDDDTSRSFFTIGEETDNMVKKYLPDGFVTRTHETGFVVPMWAPQREILAHRSVGGFLTHCGWNSTIESISGGVPMIAWPLYAEQKMNATLLREELKVAVGPKIQPTDGVIGREEIEMMVRKIMEKNEEGNEMRRRVRDLKKSAEKEFREGGASYNSLCQVAKECENKLHGIKTRVLGGA